MAPTRIPGVEYARAPRTQSKGSALAWPPRLVVIHDTGNPNSDRYDEANYAATRTDPQKDWTSAHAYIDAGGVLGSLPLNYAAWAAYSYANAHGFHLEMCKPGGSVAAATITNTARITRVLCDLAGIPRVKLSPAEVAAGKSGVCGHYDITVGLGVGSHTDPGKNFGWTDFMRQVNDGASAPPPSSDPPAPRPDGWQRSLSNSLPTLQRGSKGRAVRHLQGGVNVHSYKIAEDGDFGPGTERAVRSYQGSHGLLVDGVVGDNTWWSLVGQHITQVQRGSSGHTVTVVQAQANTFGAGLTEDGDFGPATERAIRNIQASNGASVDGVVGPVTWRVLLTR